nr:MAG TPA: LCHB VK21, LANTIBIOTICS, LCHB, ANTIBIOTIC [Caudoviricetes sp.]DAV20669.1 MAG TPA: LCHB VK21, LANTIBIOTICS, LCHB, ANTIBIOTIC [Bacteriophage sp.]
MQFSRNAERYKIGFAHGGRHISVFGLYSITLYNDVIRMRFRITDCFLHPSSPWVCGAGGVISERSEICPLESCSSRCEKISYVGLLVIMQNRSTRSYSVLTKRGEISSLDSWIGYMREYPVCRTGSVAERDGIQAVGIHSGIHRKGGI